LLHDVLPGFGPGALRFTSLSGAVTGIGRRRSWSNSE
jgi:hypothetical protein